MSLVKLRGVRELAKLRITGFVPCGKPLSFLNAEESQSFLATFGIRHVENAMLLRAFGDSMQDAGIYNGNVLLVDTMRPPANGNIVVASVNGELTAKRLRTSTAGEFALMPENPRFLPIDLGDFDSVEILGVVVSRAESML